jgi:2Fe-2S ferredoxin
LAKPDERTEEAGARVIVQTRQGDYQLVIPLRVNLLRSLVAAEIPYRWSCEQATCGKCQCQVIQGGEHLSRPTVNEPARLSQTLVGMGFRLACQAKVISPGEIRLIQR